MKLTYLSQTYFPFLVPRKDATFAARVGPRTLYPCGYSLEQALQIYWSAQNYQIIASGNGSLLGVTQALTINQLMPPRNANVGTGSYLEVSGLNLSAPGYLTPGVGTAQTVPGSGTITATGGTNPSAVFNLQVYLFFPPVFVTDPVVQYGGQWWPAMAISCSVTNTVTLTGGGSRSISFLCDSYNASSTVEIGTFSFFGTPAPVSCASLGGGETRTFSGSIAVAANWP